VAFGVDDKLYRLGCDKRVYSIRPDDKKSQWSQLGGDVRAESISAVHDSLWIIADSLQPMKFNQQLKRFQYKGNKKGVSISVGLNGVVFMMGRADSRPYAWNEAEESWKSIGWSPVINIGAGRTNLMYQVEPRATSKRKNQIIGK
jgi:hypothetical protein